MNRFKDKVVIVTGAASGQGAVQAARFAAEGANVVLTDRSEQGTETAKKIGVNALFVHHDVSEKRGWDAVVEATLSRFGKINVLINNAGIYRPKPLQETSEELFEQHYKVNQLGVFLGMQAVLEPMKKAGGGSIVNTSSVAGLGGFAGMIAYSSSKWAVRGLTKCAAADLGPLGIRVNSIHPGAIDTPMLAANSPELNKAFISMTPLGRLGTSEDVAGLVLFLASDEAAFITGAEVTVDGGVKL